MPLSLCGQSILAVVEVEMEKVPKFRSKMKAIDQLFQKLVRKMLPDRLREVVEKEQGEGVRVQV